MKSKKQILLISLIAIGLFISILGVYGLIGQISQITEIGLKESESYNDPFNQGEPKSLYFTAGKYDIYKLTYSFYDSIGDGYVIQITDPNNADVQITKSILSSNFDLNNREYRLYGSFKAVDSGNYTIQVSEESVLLFLDEGNFLRNIFSLIFNIFMIIFGVILILAGVLIYIILYVLGKDNKKPKPPEQGI